MVKVATVFDYCVYSGGPSRLRLRQSSTHKLVLMSRDYISHVQYAKPPAQNNVSYRERY